MRDYSGITRVRISESEAETNELLSGKWVLMDKVALLECIRSFRREVLSELDRLEDAG